MANAKTFTVMDMGTPCAPPLAEFTKLRAANEYARDLSQRGGAYCVEGNHIVFWKSGRNKNILKFRCDYFNTTGSHAFRPGELGPLVRELMNRYKCATQEWL